MKYYLNKLNGLLYQDYTIDYSQNDDYIELTSEQVREIGEHQENQEDAYYEDGEIKFRRNEQNYLQYLRQLRETECYSYINRGKLWYDDLTVLQLAELTAWYIKWKNITITKVIPEKPSWLE